ncbi:MAG TPA: hypothetical protein PLC52_01645 [Anaerolineales bacterium]|nr:hypothetical protein [Anaerolineales bacterium]HRQ91556.1 hypothetical protein [Anaerolineales bacterium]
MLRKLSSWGLTLTTKRMWVGLGVLALLIVLFGFTRRVAEFSRLSDQLEREQAYITELAATQQSLQDSIAYANSEAAVEAWAREQGRWSRPGDFPVIPLPPAEFTPQAPTPQAEFDTAASNFDIWWSWFFYRGP